MPPVRTTAAAPRRPSLALLAPLLVAIAFTCALADPFDDDGVEPAVTLHYEMGPLLDALAEEDHPGPAPSRRLLRQSLADLVRNTAYPDGWRAYGGLTAELDVQQDTFIIHARYAVHHHILHLFEQLTCSPDPTRRPHFQPDLYKPLRQSIGVRWRQTPLRQVADDLPRSLICPSHSTKGSSHSTAWSLITRSR